jgi:pimeloyl-ACP methyl ester carboxylesterase
MQIIVDDLVVNYKVEGEGDAVLLLHGWGDKLETFNQLTQELKSHYEVVRLDLPGFGKTETPKQTYNLQSYADFLQKFLQKTVNTHLHAVIGHSNGGAIAIKSLANENIHSDKLVLLASSGVRTGAKGYKKPIRLLVKTAKIPTKILPNKYQNKLRRKVYDKIGSDMFVAENMQETFKKVVSEDLVEQSRNIKANTLLVYGEDDTATPVEYGKAFHRSIKNSKLETIPNTGHFLHHEKPEIIEDVVIKFLSK